MGTHPDEVTNPILKIRNEAKEVNAWVQQKNQTDSQGCVSQSCLTRHWSVNSYGFSFLLLNHTIRKRRKLRNCGSVSCFRSGKNTPKVQGEVFWGMGSEGRQQVNHRMFFHQTEARGAIQAC